MNNETLITRCPHCGNRLKAPITSAGKQATCAGCGGAFVVVEKAPQPQVFIGPRKPHEDDVLSPPVRLPTYKDTPIKPGIRRPAVPAPLTGEEENYGRTSIASGSSAPAYRVMRVAAEGLVIFGALGMIVGLVILVYALVVTGGNGQGGQGLGRGLLAGRGVWIFVSGMAGVGLGEALRAMRDVAINSFLTANR